MRFEWFVARRYLRSPNRPAVLRLVTAFSVLGVTAGVATLVIALAMNTGFRETLQDRLLGVTAHISLTRPGSGGLHDYEALATKLSKIPGVRSVTPAVYQTVLMTFGGESRGVVAKGIDPVREELPEAAPVIAREIEQDAGPGFAAATWMEQQGALFRALRLEKLVTAIFIGLITLVAGLNILVVLSMTVTDRAKDIAVLRSMGSTSRQLRNIFLWQGFTIGAAGTLPGLVLGYFFALIAGKLRLIRLDPQVYAVAYVPFHPSAMDGVWISLVAMGISLLATLVPARAAARLLPVEILRFE